MADTEYHDNGHDDYDLVHENEVNEAGFPRQRTKSETLAELRRKEQGQKVPLTKVDYTSHLRKTNKTEVGSRERKSSDESPKYLDHLRKAETGIDTKPMYVRLRETNEETEKIPEKKFTAEELMNMAFKKAEDAEKRDPALRRGIVSKPASSPGTFQGLQIANNEKEDYRAALKQHVNVEPKITPKAQDNKPSWANVQSKRVLEIDMKSRQAKENSKQNAPEWAQLNRGGKINVVGLDSGKAQEKPKAPEWANLVNKTDRRRLIELEHKKNPLADSKQPEWASKPKDAREILRVENRRKPMNADADQPDYRGALRKGCRKESSTFCDLQTSLDEVEAVGWRLIKRLDVDDDSCGENSKGIEPRDQVFDEQSNSRNLNDNGKDFESYDCNGKTGSQNGGSKIQNGRSDIQNGRSDIQNGRSGSQNGGSISEKNEKKPRRKFSGFQEKSRRKSSANRFSLASALPADLKVDVEDILMDWVQEIMNDYQDCNITDFTTSWEDGMAFCDIMHFYENEKVPVEKLNNSAKRSNLTIAFQVASDSGIQVPISVDDFMKNKVPDAGKVFDILHAIYTNYHGPIVEWGSLNNQ